MLCNSRVVVVIKTRQLAKKVVFQLHLVLMCNLLMAMQVGIVVHVVVLLVHVDFTMLLVVVLLVLPKIANVSIVAKWAIGHAIVIKDIAIRLETTVCTPCRLRMCMVMKRSCARVCTPHLHQKTENGADYKFFATKFECRAVFK